MWLLISFSYLLLAKAAKTISNGIAFALWEGLGIALITVVSVLFLDYHLNAQELVGLALAIVGIVLVTMGETHDEPTTGTGSIRRLGAAMTNRLQVPAAPAVLAQPMTNRYQVPVAPAVLALPMINRCRHWQYSLPWRCQGGRMHPLIIVLGAALLDIGANMAINRSVGFRHKGWGFLGILLVLCAFTLLSEAVSTGKIDLAVAYATWVPSAFWAPPSVACCCLASDSSPSAGSACW